MLSGFYLKVLSVASFLHFVLYECKDGIEQKYMGENSRFPLWLLIDYSSVICQRIHLICMIDLSERLIYQKFGEPHALFEWFWGIFDVLWI